MSKDQRQFVFMTCRAGAEGALKQEVGRTSPEWRVAFSRPGFLTFKHLGDRPLDDAQLAERQWTFAHAHGISLGRVAGEHLSQLTDQLWKLEGVVALAASLADIHVWQREEVADRRASDELHSLVTPLAAEIECAIRQAAPASCTRLRRQSTAPRRASPRQRMVLDVVVVEPGQWWVGYHRATTLAERWPGGLIPVTMPEQAVSRAYGKLEEAVAWSGLPLAQGDECVEIGCAPGGASQALLDRGMFVTGIDPADVDPRVARHPRFRHLRKRGKEVPRKEFEGVRWLVADMNIAPQATLETVESIVTHPGVTIRGLILTLKLSEWEEAERLPQFAARVRAWGYRDVRIRQLVRGAQEVCLVALRRKALRRLARARNRTSRPETQGRRRDGAHKSAAGPHF
jgi:23S rRNA (cytidine2498-2'-O)-methyltransferase